MLNTRKRQEAGSSNPSASKPTRTPGPASGRQVHECQMQLSLTPTPGHLGVEVARLWRRPCRRGERAHPRKAGRRPGVDRGVLGGGSGTRTGADQTERRRKYRR